MESYKPLLYLGCQEYPGIFCTCSCGADNSLELYRIVVAADELWGKEFPKTLQFGRWVINGKLFICASDWVHGRVGKHILYAQYRSENGQEPYLKVVVIDKLWTSATPWMPWVNW